MWLRLLAETEFSHLHAYGKFNHSALKPTHNEQLSHALYFFPPLFPTFCLVCIQIQAIKSSKNLFCDSHLETLTTKQFFHQWLVIFLPHLQFMVNTFSSIIRHFREKKVTKLNKMSPGMKEDIRKQSEWVISGKARGRSKQKGKKNGEDGDGKWKCDKMSQLGAKIRIPSVLNEIFNYTLMSGGLLLKR